MFDFIPTEVLEVDVYGQRLRITMRAVGSLGYARFSELRLMLARSVAGDDEFSIDNPRAVTIINTYRLAALFVSLVDIEIEQKKGWVKLSPKGPADLGEIPGSVLAQCEEVYCRLNPDLFANYAKFEGADATEETEEVDADDESQKKDEPPTESA